MSPVTWSSLELAKLVVGILTPVSVAVLAWFLNARLKRLDLIQWTNQKLIEKRLAVYDLVAPQLNQLLCFFTWVGYWKDISPPQAIQAKRDLDKAFNIYRHLFDESVYISYQAYIHMLFETFTGPGHDAKIRSKIVSSDGDRKSHATYEWTEGWEASFTSDESIPQKADVRLTYRGLMEQLTRSFGVKP